MNVYVRTRTVVILPGLANFGNRATLLSRYASLTPPHGRDEESKDGMVRTLHTVHTNRRGCSGRHSEENVAVTNEGGLRKRFCKSISMHVSRGAVEKAYVVGGHMQGW